MHKAEPRAVDLREVAVENLDNIRSRYSNQAAVTMTMWDFRLIFSEIIVEGPPGAIPQVRCEVRGSIVMSPAHAKVLAKVLDDNIKLYEKENGEIPWPKGVEK